MAVVFDQVVGEVEGEPPRPSESAESEKRETPELTPYRLARLMRRIDLLERRLRTD